MSDYSKSTNFTTKDTLPTGNAGKIVKGTELDTEFTAISSAIASKADVSSPSLLGTPTSPTATSGSNTTQIANTAFVKAAIDTLSLGNMSTQAKTAVEITGGTITGITDLAVADGGTGSSTLSANAVLLGNGTSALQTVAPGTSGNVLKSNGTTWTSTAPAVPSGLGLNGETWHSVSRSASTVYQNNRAYPIMVNVGGLSTGSSVTFYCDATTSPSQVAATSNFGGSNVNGNMPSVIVPPYFYYSCTASGGTWYELY
jgi:hypothetical protein